MEDVEQKPRSVGRVVSVIFGLCILPATCWGLNWMTQRALSQDILFEADTDGISADVICASTPLAGPVEVFCNYFGASGTLQLVAVGLMVAAVLMTLYSVLVSRLGKPTDASIVARYRFGTFLVIIGGIGLLTVTAALVVASMFLFAMSAGGLSTMVMIGTFAFLVFAFIAVVTGLAMLARALFLLLRAPVAGLPAMPLLESEAPAVWAAVREIAAAMSTPPPDHILTGIDASFFVADGVFDTATGRVKGRVLNLSLPFARIMSLAELRSVLAHEMAHLRSDDTGQSRRISSVVRTAREAHRQMIESISYEQQLILVVPALRLIELFIDNVFTDYGAISRRCEIAADAASAAATSSAAAGFALVKIHAFGGAWQNTADAINYHEGQGERLVNVSDWFVRSAFYHAKSNQVDALAQSVQTHPYDSHPPLLDRLTALGVKLEDFDNASVTQLPDQPLSTLIPDHLARETHLSYLIALMPHLPFKEAVKRTNNR
jgi:Zn-dependent protease with chaperone function